MNPLSEDFVEKLAIAMYNLGDELEPTEWNIVYKEVLTALEDEHDDVIHRFTKLCEEGNCFLEVK